MGQKEEAEEREERFAGFQVDGALMAAAGPQVRFRRYRFFPTGDFRIMGKGRGRVRTGPLYKHDLAVR
jgi:hypothetical protein